MVQGEEESESDTNLRISQQYYQLTNNHSIKEKKTSYIPYLSKPAFLNHFAV